MAVASLGSLFVQTQIQSPTLGPQVVGGALMFAVFSAAGVWTAIGVLLLRPWARTAILIFAGFLAVGSVLFLLTIMAVPMPPDISPATVQQARRVMGIVFGVLIGIAVWWLIQFNTRSTKAAFAATLEQPASRRPISITIIAWGSILGGASCLLAILSRSPAFLFGANIEGWMAAVVYAVFGVLTLYIGKGLLDLREEARILGIGWAAFSILHTGAISLVAPLRRRMLDLSQSLTAADPRTHIVVPDMLLNLVFGFAMVTLAATIWFLIRHRAAFGQLEHADTTG
jgi:magnesium-transporting ATPase (P-type)